MQTILGAGGDIGKLLALELKNYTSRIRLVSRNPIKVNDTDELFIADLTNREAVFEAVKGSSVVYLTVGYAYKLKIWKQLWIPTMQNTIDACLAHGAKLVFFDNIYMYGKEAMSHITEDCLIDPPSKKGKIRATVAQILLDAVKREKLEALIARSADFYGKASKNSVLKILVMDNFRKGKRACWQSDLTKIHSFTFTADAAKGTALLGNTEDAYGEVWHLPTSPEKLTGKDYIDLTAELMNVKSRHFVLSKTLIGLLGLFMPQMKELKEMQYQNDRDYFFDSSKFNKRFNYTPASYRQGIAESLR